MEYLLCAKLKTDASQWDSQHTHEDQTPLTEGSERANLSPVVTQQASGELGGGGGHHTQALSIVSERSLFQKAVLSQHEASAKRWLPDLQFLSPPLPRVGTFKEELDVW